MAPRLDDPAGTLRDLRAARGWSRRMLALKLREAARARGHRVLVTHQAVRRWELGHRSPGLYHRRLIADLLGSLSGADGGSAQG